MLNCGYVSVLAPLYRSPSLSVCGDTGVVGVVFVDVLLLVVATLGSF